MLAMEARTFWIPALAGGLLAGTLDLIYAFVWMAAFHDKSPLWVLQSVASGWNGKAAFEGGGLAGAVGFASHFGISIVAAGLYIVASRGLPLMREHWIVCGAIFGVLVYLFMNFVVIAYSAAPFKPSLAPAVIIRGFISHALLFGIPIAWCAGAAPSWMRA
jgi:hypothetical protein